MIQNMQQYTQHDMQHSNPHTHHPQRLGWGVGWGEGVGPLGMGGVGVRMLHIMLCIMLHVLDLLLRCRDKDFGLINYSKRSSTCSIIHSMICSILFPDPQAV